MIQDIRHFVKNNSSFTVIPLLYSTLPSGKTQWHFTDTEKENCLNDSFASISTDNDENIALTPFKKLTNNSLPSIHYTEK